MKEKRENIFIVLCLAVGLLTIIAKGGWLTSQSLIETLMFLIPLLYLGIKYTTIGNKSVTLSAPVQIIIRNIALPVCLELCYACAFLYVIKDLHFINIDFVALLTYKLYEFNEETLRISLLGLSTIIGILAIFKYLSFSTLQKYKKRINVISAPVKLLTMLMFFINTDAGVHKGAVNWRLDTSIPKKIDNPSFNAANINDNQSNEEQIKEIVRLYTEIIVDSLQQAVMPRDISDQADASFNKAVLSIEDTRAKEFRLAVQQLNLGKDVLDSSEYVDINKWLPPHPILFEQTELYNAGYSKTESELEQVKDALSEKRASMNITSTSHIADIIKWLLEGWVEQTLFYKSAESHLSYLGIAEDNTFDVLKKKFLNGLFFLLRKGKVTPVDIEDTKEYAVSTLSYDYGKEVSYISSMVPVFPKYSKQYAHALSSETRLHKIVGADFNNPTPDSVKRRHLSFFVSKYPTYRESRYFEFVIGFIDAKYQNTSDQFETLKQEYPDYMNDYGSIIDGFIQFKNDYNTAIAQNSSAQWEQFLTDHPNVPNRGEIQNTIDILKIREADNISTHTYVMENYKSGPNQNESPKYTQPNSPQPNYNPPSINTLQTPTLQPLPVYNSYRYTPPEFDPVFHF